MTDPQPPARPDADSKGGQRKLLIAAAIAVLILLVLGGIEAFNQLARQTSAPVPTPSAVAESPPADAPPAREAPVVAAQPEAAVQPEAAGQKAVAEAPTPEPVVQAPAPVPVIEAPASQETAAAPTASAVPAAEAPAAPVEAATEAPATAPTVKPVENEPELVEPAAAETVTAVLIVTRTKGGPPIRSTGDVVWSANAYPSLSTQFAGTVTFASGGSATIVFSRSFVATPPLTVDVSAKDGPLEGVAAIAVLRAGGKDIAIEIGLEHATLADSGAADGSFQALADATEIVLALLFENGDTGILTLAKPPGGGLEAVLFPDRPPGSEPKTSSQGQ